MSTLSTKIPGGLFVILVSFFCAQPLAAQSPRKSFARPEKSRTEKYRGKSQVFTFKGEILGGEFRISNVIPLRGDFSKFRRIEVTRLQSLIGDHVPAKILAKYSKFLFEEFQRGGRFNDIVTIDNYKPPPRLGVTQNNAQATQSVSPLDARTGLEESQDSLDGPMLTADDMRRFDQLRAKRQNAERDGTEQSPGTLVIVAEVIEYMKGNVWLRLLPLDRGNSIITLRFRYYDKETGEEVGRQVITGEVNARNLGGVLGLRNALSGVAEGLADQVTRRAVSAER